MENHISPVLTELASAVSALRQDQLDALRVEVTGAGRTFCEGLGRSALPMRGFAMRLMQLGLASSFTGEDTCPAFRKGDLLLLCSSSGASRTLFEHAQKAKELGGRVALLTGSPDSPLAALADAVAVIPAPNKDSAPGSLSSVQPMGALFEQSAQIACDILVLDLMESLRVSPEEMRKNHRNLE